jgi:hypothetical protein
MYKSVGGVDGLIDSTELQKHLHIWMEYLMAEDVLIDRDDLLSGK